MNELPNIETQMGPEELAQLLEITPPFLLIDALTIKHATELTQWQGVGIKQLSATDWFFACHLPSAKAMPATLITEGMLQTLVGLIYSSIDHGAHRSFVTHLNVQLKRGATEGDALRYQAVLLSNRRGLIKGQVQVFANNQAIGQGEFLYASPHLMVLPSAKSMNSEH